MRGITKRFPGVLANDSVDFTVAGAEIHAIVGENGAGKSTLMNILYGLYRQDEGTIEVRGRKVTSHSPRHSIELGLGMVHQHFMLIPPMTVAENVALGSEPRKWGVLSNIEEARRQVAELSKRFGFHLDPSARVEDLSVGLQQRIEIVKVLYRGAEILILDEPTGVLTPQEVDELFQILSALKEAGKTIVLITHKLDEVVDLADRVTVMRDGRGVGVVERAEMTTENLAEMMVGRPVLLEVERTEHEAGEVVLSVEDLTVIGRSGKDVVTEVSLDVRAGEILGIAGVEGNGQTELIESITGLRKPAGGVIRLCGREITGCDPGEIRAQGLSHIPEDRQARGLVLDFTVEENCILGQETDFSSLGIMDARAIRETSETLLDDFDIRPRRPEALTSNLSGGNQQKLIIAREFRKNPPLTIASQPTRGIDVGGIEFIHRALIEKRDSNAAILLISAELSEVMSLSDRILVMYKGRIAGELLPHQADERKLGLLMTGGAGEG
jgi:simple sugar transport system ATP-binding protein